VTVAGGKTESVAAKKDSQTGEWSFSPDTEWADGDYQLTVSVTDSAGNKATSDELQVVIDTTLNKPGITLAVGQDSGHSPTDNLTNVMTPKFLINTDKDVDKLMVKVDSGQWIAATQTGTGIWSYTPDNPLLEGKRTLEVKAIDKAGNESHESIEVTVDISLSTPKIELASGQRVVNEGSDYHTNVKQPNFVINDISDDFYTVELKVSHHGNTELIKLNKTSGQWVFSPLKEWSDGDYKLEVVVVDKAGNERVSAPYSVIINTKTSVNLIKLVSDTGKDSSDNLTTENLPAFLIEVPLNVKQVRVSEDNGKSWIELPSGKGGLWNYTATNPLPEGENTLRVEATDFLGNTAEETLKFDIDNTLSIPTIEFAAGEDTGSLVTDGLTNQSQPKFDLSNIDPDVIEVKVHVKDMIGSNSYHVSAAQDSKSGQWGFALPAKLADSSYQLTVTVIDKAGNEQTSAELKIKVDTQLNQPNITLAAGHDTGSSNSDGLTKSTRPTFDLNNLDNDVVKAQVTVNIAGKTEIADAVQDKITGKWSFTPSTTWGEGSYQLTVKVEDQAGNENVSLPLLVSIDTTFDINSINLLNASGAKYNNNLTNQTKPEFLIDMPADTATVEASLDGTNWTKIALNATGQWVMVSPSTLMDGSHTLQVKAKDKAGNEASKTLDFQIDTLLTIPEIKLGVDQDSGVSNNDAITKVSKPKFEISHIDPDVISVTVMINGVGHAATDNNGKWSFQPSTTLTAGKYDVTVKVEDQAGNTKTSSVLKLDIDVSTEVTAINLLNDNGTQTDDYIISHKTPEFDIILPKDVQSVKVSLTGKDNDWITVNKNTQGQWLFSPKTELGDKEYTLSVKIVDTAGNEATKQQKFTVDTELNVPTLKLSPHSDSGEDKSDNLTKINKPEFLIGNTDNDVDKVLINIDGKDYKVNKGGTGWSFTPPTALNDGMHTIKVTVTDIAGNSKASDTLKVEIDTQTEIKDIKLVNDSGISDSDRLTSHTRPSIEVVVAKDVSRVQVSLDGKTWADATKKSDTQWDYEATAELKDGNYFLWVKATDKAGNQANKKLDFIIDTHVDSLKIDMPDDTNKKPGGHITNVTVPRFNISAKEVLETVVVVLNGTKKELTKDAGGAWSFTPNTALGEGTHTLEVTATDKAGNSITKDITFDIDTTLLPPNIDLSNSDDSGDSNTDKITKVQQPTFIISQVPTDIDTVTITISGTNYDIKAQPDGSYQFKPPVALSDGEYVAVVTFTDIAGNIVNSTLPFTIDTSVHLTAKMDPAYDSGSSTIDNITNNTQPAFKVTADADSRVEATIIDNANGREVYRLSDTIPQSGNLDFKADTLSDGNYIFKVTATDIAGNIETSTTKFTIDTTAIDPTIELSSHAPNNQFEALDLVPEFKGTAEEGSSVILSVDGKPVDTVTTNANGTWRWMPSTHMPSGEHAVSVMTTDKAGNKSQEKAISVKIPYLDVKDPTIKMDEKSDTGALGDFITSNQQPTIVGLAFPDTEVTIYLDNAKVGSVFADPLGNYSYTLPTKAEGSYHLKVGIKDPRDAKQIFSEEVKLVIDTHLEDYTWNVEDLHTGHYIKTESPMLNGNAEPNSIITILVDGKERTKAIADASGKWKSTLPSLGTTGEYSIAIQVEDLAGNKKLSDPKAITIDTSHDAFSVNLKPSDDSGVKNDDRITNKSHVTLQGETEPGAGIQIYNEQGFSTIRATANDTGQWSAEVPLIEGLNKFSVYSVDKADNNSNVKITITRDSSINISAISLSDESNTGDRYDLVTSKKDAVLQAKTDPFASVEVIINGQSQGHVKANSSGTATFPLPKDSNDGEYKVQFIATDDAGNIAASPIVTVTLDSTISHFSVDSLPEQTNQQGLPVSGKGEPDAKIEIYVNGVITGSTTVDKNGTWNTSVGLNTDDDYAIKIKISDVAGNFMESKEFNVKRDSFMVAPTIQLSPTTNSGAKDDGITNVNKPLLIGTAKAGATIILFMDDREFARVIADDTGNWSYECQDALKDGEYYIHVTAQDKAGNTVNSHRLPITIDIDTFVGTPVMTADSQYSGMNTSAIVSKTANPIFSIDAELRQYVEVFIDGKLLDKVLISKSGQRYKISTVLSDGEHTISYSIIDKAGNKAESKKVPFIVDTSNIVPVTLDTINDATVESIIAQYGKIYIRDSSNLVTLRGQADADSRVEFNINGFRPDNVWADENGNWSLEIDFASFNEGQIIIEMKSTDRGGHTNSGARTLWLDTSISEFTCFLKDNKTPDKTLWSSGDDITVMHGKGEVGATISLMHDGKLVESTVVGTDGMWQISTNKLPDGESNIILTIKDLAEHQKSEHKKIYIDRSTPEVPEITDPQLLPNGGIALSGTAAGASWVYLIDKDGQHIGTAIVSTPTGEWNAYIKKYPPEGKVGIFSKSKIGSISETKQLDFLQQQGVITLDPASDTGVSGDNVTSHTKPTFNIDGIDNDVVSVELNIDGNKFNAHKVADGKWAATPDSELHHGKYTITATVTDKGNNTQTSKPYVFNIDIQQAQPENQGNPVDTTQAAGASMVMKRSAGNKLTELDSEAVNNQNKEDEYRITLLESSEDGSVTQLQNPKFEISVPKDVISVIAELDGREHELTVVDQKALFQATMPSEDGQYTLEVKFTDKDASFIIKDKQFTIDHSSDEIIRSMAENGKTAKETQSTGSTSSQHGNNISEIFTHSPINYSAPIDEVNDYY
ncbi:TPA: Ig-like domain repeat protein, partial [Yersinia enterocolitica]|nr:Ig-like domain repeat protein [Yersinia enterocolitica]